MKTAISLPDATFNEVSARATALGMSRSEFFTRAAERFIEELDSKTLTEQIDRALDQVDGSDDSWVDSASVGKRVLESHDSAW